MDASFNEKGPKKEFTRENIKHKPKAFAIVNHVVSHASTVRKDIKHSRIEIIVFLCILTKKNTNWVYSY